MDCNEGSDSCYAFVEDDSVYSGERIGGSVCGWEVIICSIDNYNSSTETDEPSPGAVSSIEGCRLWAELWMDDGAAFFHFNSTSEECHLYRTLDEDCQVVGGPRGAPSFDQCTSTTTMPTTTPSAPTKTTGTKSRLSVLVLDICGR